MNWKVILHSVIAAFAGGALTAITAELADPGNFNLSTKGLEHLGAVALTGALTGVLALLKQSPLPNPANAPDATPAPANSTPLKGTK